MSQQTRAAMGTPASPIPARRISTFTPRELRGTTKHRAWRAPGRKAFAPKPGEPGSTVVFEVNGRRMSGPVWDKGPKRGEVWVVLDGKTYLVSGSRQ